MGKKGTLGAVVANWKGYRLRHLNPNNGGRLAIFKGKKQFGEETFPNKEAGLKLLKKLTA